jgi:pimeloyl-ACP methyl ester carboxylesterase
MSVSEVLEQCVTTVLAMNARPIVVAHDAGAALALRMARAVQAPAAVLIAPVLPGYAARRRLVGGIRRAAACVLGRPLDLPAGPAGATLFEGTDALVREVVRARAVSEDGTFLYSLLREPVPQPEIAGHLPVLVLCGNDDPVVPPAAAKAVASDLGGVLVALPGGHWLPVEAGWRETVGQVHRWIVRTLGDPLLLFREETDEEAPQ